jgi:hypothetical protein
MNYQDRKEKKNIVILIHGTTSLLSSENPIKEITSAQYWGNVRVELQQRLPDNYTLEFFDWSGDNSEKSRRKGAESLCSRLTELEAQNIDYHLIAHSHGGSVILGALNEFTKKEQELSSLKSWITIGTPFFKFNTKIDIWYWLSLGIIAFAVIYLFFYLFPYLWSFILIISNTLWANLKSIPSDLRDLFNPDFERIINFFVFFFGNKPNELSLFIIFFCSAMFPVLSFLVFGLRVFALLCSPFLVILFIVLYFGVFVNSVVSQIEVRDVSQEIKNYNRNSNYFLKKYGLLWLGICSKNDEAINGLKLSLFKKELAIVNNSRNNLEFTIQSIFIYLGLKCLKERLNIKISERLKNLAHGNDMPSSDALCVF